MDTEALDTAAWLGTEAELESAVAVTEVVTDKTKLAPMSSLCTNEYVHVRLCERQSRNLD